MLRTLIVEDDRHVADVTRAFVERHEQFSVAGIAGTAAGAAGALGSLDIDVVLLDMQLPDGLGVDVLRTARARGFSGEVIALTAARDVDTVRVARQLGVRHYLVKPFSMKALHERMDEVAQSLDEPSASGSALAQEDVDRLMTGSVPVQQAKGSHTLGAVAEALAAAGEGASASVLGERLGISRVTARRHLERLVAQRRAEVEPVYGRAGRPEMVYRSLDVG